jgi:hypothetical protein
MQVLPTVKCELGGNEIASVLNDVDVLEDSSQIKSMMIATVGKFFERNAPCPVVSAYDY